MRYGVNYSFVFLYHISGMGERKMGGSHYRLDSANELGQIQGDGQETQSHEDSEQHRRVRKKLKCICVRYMKL